MRRLIGGFLGNYSKYGYSDATLLESAPNEFTRIQIKQFLTVFLVFCYYVLMCNSVYLCLWSSLRHIWKHLTGSITLLLNERCKLCNVNSRGPEGDIVVVGCSDVQLIWPLQSLYYIAFIWK